MQFPKQLAQLAQQQALAGFGALTEHMLADADNSMAQAGRTAGAEEQAALSGARSLVRFEGQVLRTRMQQQFAILLERAMQTMHIDLRADLREVRFDELSLLDDAVMDRQILVDRLLLRLRDADQLSLGRLNVIIAQLHGVSEVRERENPFRPWLLARALYEAASSMVQDELRLRILFQHLSTAMAAHLHDYYGAVLAVFEQRGVVGHLAARPSQLTRAERERLAWQRAAEEAARPGAGAGTGTGTGTAGAASAAAAGQPAAGLLPALRQMMSGAPLVPSAFPDLDGFDESQDLRALVRRIGVQGAGLNPAPGAGAGAAGGAAFSAAAGPASLLMAGRAAAQERHEPPTPALVEALRRAQQAVLAGSGASAPLQLARQLDSASIGRGARQRLQLVALLFEFMLEDGLLDAALRAQLGRLFIPYVRVVLAEPELPVQADHAARRLVDRIGQLVAACYAEAPQRHRTEELLRRAVDDVLRRFDGDLAVFAVAEGTLDAALTDLLLGVDDAHAACSAAIAEAESASLDVAAAAAALEPLLTPLRTDPRLAAFLRTTWVRVLARSQEGGQDGLLAELVWSAQAKLDAAEHGALMRMLPVLVKRVRDGLARLGLPEAESKAALDQLVAVHMDVMANRQDPAAGAMGLDALRQYFAPIGRRAPLPRDTPAWPRRGELAPALARYGAAAVIHAEPADIAETPGEAALLAGFRAGTGFEFLEGGAYINGCLVAHGAAFGAFVFSVPGHDAPLVYLRAALLQALRDETVRTLEYAPVFERAIARLTVSVDALGVNA